MVHRMRILLGKPTPYAIDIHPSRSVQKLGAPAMLVAHSDGVGWFYEDYWSGMMSNLYVLRCFCKVPLNFELGVWWNFWNLLVPFQNMNSLSWGVFRIISCSVLPSKTEEAAGGGNIYTAFYCSLVRGYLSSKQVILLSADYDFKGLGMYGSERGKIVCTTVGQ